jgi:hypothetical protein
MVRELKGGKILFYCRFRWELWKDGNELVLRLRNRIASDLRIAKRLHIAFVNNWYCRDEPRFKP